MHVWFALVKSQACSAQHIQQGAAAAELDGLSCAGLQGLGSGGRQSQNSNRDLKRLVRRMGLANIEPYSVSVPVRRRDNVGVDVIERKHLKGPGGVEGCNGSKVPVVLPFDVLGYLSDTCSEAEFEKRVLGPGGSAGVAEWWQHAGEQDCRVRNRLASACGVHSSRHLGLSLIHISEPTRLALI
eukprot:4180751-Alexandrium_andersonii.AAC.1